MDRCHLESWPTRLGLCRQNVVSQWTLRITLLTCKFGTSVTYGTALRRSTGSVGYDSTMVQDITGGRIRSARQSSFTTTLAAPRCCCGWERPVESLGNGSWKPNEQPLRLAPSWRQTTLRRGSDCVRRSNCGTSSPEIWSESRPASFFHPWLRGIRTRIIHPAPNDLTSFPFLSVGSRSGRSHSRAHIGLT